jgi:hypothetical protein
MAQKPLNIVALKRLARREATRNGTLLSSELDKLAVKEGYQNWSVLVDNQKKLAERATTDRFIEDVYIRVGKGDRNLPPGSIQLILDEGALERPRPWSAMLVFILDDGRPAITGRVRLDFYHKEGRLSPEIESALLEAANTNSSILVPEHWPFYTWFPRPGDYLQFASHGYWKAEQVLRSVNDLTFGRATGHHPAWYDLQEHNALFENLDDDFGDPDEVLEDVFSFFSGNYFKRGSDGQRLARRLEQIKPGSHHAQAFQQWVADAMTVLFPEGLTRVRLDPNGANPARRDIVATNTRKGSFFGRLRNDYGVSMVVFEAKNYAKPRARDFDQVGGYLNAPHHGSIGFLVTHAPTKVIEEASWEQFRRIYNGDGKRKLVIVLPSAFLVELLDSLWRERRDEASEAMELWIDALLKHLRI